jgi:predicted enzyme related to lactoylglutathione lyase
MPAAIVRLILPVSDIERATTFYGRLLHQPGRRLAADAHEFSCGGAVLECRVLAGAAPHAGGLVFAVPDLDNHYGRASTSGCRAIGRIEAAPDGRSFLADDPFGNRLRFLERAPVAH